MVTIAEAAKRLGVDPTQVRRWARKLKPEDRTDRTGQCPLSVRLSSLEAVRQAQGRSKDTGQTGQDSVLSVTHREAHTLAAVVDQYQRRIEELEAHRQALSAANEALLAEVQRDRDRLAVEAERSRLEADALRAQLADAARPWWRRWMRR